jgi:hypothetical protein
VSPNPQQDPLGNVRFVFFSDPDGNGWAVQQISARGSPSHCGRLRAPPWVARSQSDRSVSGEDEAGGPTLPQSRWDDLVVHVAGPPGRVEAHVAAAS